MNSRIASIALLTAALALPSLASERQRYTVATDGSAQSSRLRMAANAVEERERNVRRFERLDGFAADLTAEEAEALRHTPGVVDVHPVVERHINGVSTMPLLSNLESYTKQVIPWGVPVVRARDVWPVTRGEGVNVVVLDTGIDPEHPDLKAAYVGGYNVLAPANPPIDDNFHGTHVSGTIAAQDNDFGVVGVAPGVKLWAVKTMDQTGKGYDEGIAAGIDWVIAKQAELGGRWVINMSISAAAEGGVLERRACARAFDAGIILVAAAGNNGRDLVEYPALYPGVIAVGAVGEDGKRADFSTYGQKVEIFGPGVLVQSTLTGTQFKAAEVDATEKTALGWGLIGSPYGSVTGQIVDAGLGHPEEIPPQVSGNIALIKRGDLEFREKVRNAREAGAKAVVIWNNQPDSNDLLWTLTPKGCVDNDPACPPEWKNYPFPVSIAISYEDGLALKQLPGRQVTASYFLQKYGRLSGTSMATPHVAAVAALLLALDPTLRPADIMWLLRNTAHDTSEPGWDYQTGYGIVDALAAGKLAAPAKFNIPPPPPPVHKRRSSRP